MICRRTILWPVSLLVLLSLCGPVRLAWAEPLLLVAGMPEWDLPAAGTLPDARLVSIGPDGKLQFQTSGGELNLFPADLVRWSTPRDRSPTRCLVLTDGSRLAFSEPWDQQPMLLLSGDEVTVHSSLLGRPSLSRSQLRAIVLRGPAESGQYDRLLTRLLAWQGPGDQLHLVGGDRLAGRLISIGRASPIGRDAAETARPTASESRASELVTFDSEMGRITVPYSRVAGLSLQPVRPAQHAPAGPRMGVGLRDGSWLVCDRLAGRRGDAGTSGFQLHLITGLDLICGDLRNLVALQQLGSMAEESLLIYLSDLEADRYRHQPYLDIPWVYRNDLNVRGGRLRVKGRPYPKGLGMHSASRLTYRIPRGWERMAAQVAIDEMAGERGSVVFRVELLRGGEWREVYRSPIVPGGQPPRGLSVELAGAEQLALITEYADRGDEWDDANWLDARLERRVPSRESGQEPGDQ
jgi:hypothetical protein